MTLIKDFDKLHIGLKTGSLTILGQVPFFFVSLYLFKKSIIERIDNTYFISDLDFYFVICVCFALSLTWFLMNLGLTGIVVYYVDKWMGIQSELQDVYIMTFIYSIGYVSAAILINYYCDAEFITLILWMYGFIVARILWAIGYNQFILPIITRRIN